MVDGVKPTIPLTPIVARYKALATSRKGRHAQAEQDIAQPGELLAREFAASITAFQAYSNDEPFYPEKPVRTVPTENPDIDSTIDLAYWLSKQGSVTEIDEAHDGGHDLLPGVRRVPASDLGFDYLDREIVATRKTGGVTFEDGSSPRSALRLDLLLASHDGRVPIIGEAKIKTDKDPYAALIQVLTCAAHLATQRQYERVRLHYGEDRIAPHEGNPTLDLYIILVRFPMRATLIPELLADASTLSQLLLARPEVNKTIRRIACLEINLAGTQLKTTSKFAYERAV
jgi:hypothetical protein